MGRTYNSEVLSCCLPKYPSPETAFSRNSFHWNYCFLTRSSLNRSNNRASLYRSLLPKWFHLFWKIVILFIEVKRWFWAFFAPKQENMRNFTFQLRFVNVKFLQKNVKTILCWNSRLKQFLERIRTFLVEKWIFPTSYLSFSNIVGVWSTSYYMREAQVGGWKNSLFT